MPGEHNEVNYHIPIQLTGLSHEIGGGSNDNKGLLVCDMGCLFPFPTPNSLTWVFNAPSVQAWICILKMLPHHMIMLPSSLTHNGADKEEWKEVGFDWKPKAGGLIVI
ncbi:unnamed protein product [Musa acuminata var. zebrina]